MLLISVERFCAPSQSYVVADGALLMLLHKHIRFFPEELGRWPITEPRDDCEFTKIIHYTDDG